MQTGKKCLSKWDSQPAAAPPVRNANYQLPLNTTESETVGPTTLFQQALQRALTPATVLQSLLSSYNIASFPKGFLAPLLPYLGKCDSSLGSQLGEPTVLVYLELSQFFN